MTTTTVQTATRLSPRYAALRTRLVEDFEAREKQLETLNEESAHEYQDVATHLLRKSAEEALLATELAIQRFDEGTYGTCVNCGEWIPLRRLESIPHAARCVECARAVSLLESDWY
jgi:RNA polymerase-binding transcription factor DksA